MLAVDLGTTNTAAAVVSEGSNEPRVVRLESSSDLMPSGVLFRDGGWETGQRAARYAGAFPECYERCPKSWFGKGQVLLGGQQFDDHVLGRVVFTEVVGRASQQHDGAAPSEVIVTHPAGWREHRLQVLERAVEMAGLSDPTLCPEPVAAVAYYTRGAKLAVGETLAVYDLGGGTLDLALLRVDDNGLPEMLGVRGDTAIGGEWFDQLIRGWLVEQLEHDGRGDVVERMLQDRGFERSVLDQLRLAKEDLSSRASADIALPSESIHLQLQRGQLEDLLRPTLERAAQQLIDLLAAHQLTPSDLTRLYLTGGSAQIPLVSETLVAAGFRPSKLDDPKLVVPKGAVHHRLSMVGSPITVAAPRSSQAAPLPPPVPMTCPRCGASQPLAEFCQRCGSSLVEPVPRPNRCRSCHAPVRLGVRFCTACGAPSPGEPRAVPTGPSCGRCGSTLRPNVRFCTACGTPRTAPAPPA